MLNNDIRANFGHEQSRIEVAGAATDQTLITTPTTLNPPKIPVIDRIQVDGDAATTVTIHTAAPSPLTLSTIQLGGQDTKAFDCHIVGEASKDIEVDNGAGNIAVRVEFHLE